VKKFARRAAILLFYGQEISEYGCQLFSETPEFGNRFELPIKNLERCKNRLTLFHQGVQNSLSTKYFEAWRRFSTSTTRFAVASFRQVLSLPRSSVAVTFLTAMEGRVIGKTSLMHAMLR
jgi:hypothetical protein